MLVGITFQVCFKTQSKSFWTFLGKSQQFQSLSWLWIDWKCERSLKSHQKMGEFIPVEGWNLWSKTKIYCVCFYSSADKMWNWLRTYSGDKTQNAATGPAFSENRPCRANRDIVAESPKCSKHQPDLQDIPPYDEFKRVLDKSNTQMKWGPQWKKENSKQQIVQYRISSFHRH